MNSGTITRHASILDDSNKFLCGSNDGRKTEPRETINCPDCRVILNHVRLRYPKNAGHTDGRLTRKEMTQVARDMYADLVCGEIEG